MDTLSSFRKTIQTVSEEIAKIPKTETVRIVSHLDCDGICAASILIKLFMKEKRRYSLSIVPHLERSILETFAEEQYSHYIFLDLGSGTIPIIKDILAGKKIFIIDHHELNGKASKDMVILNPQMANVDGSREVCSASLTFFLVLGIDQKLTDVSHLAVIGAIGDSQEDFGLFGLNKLALDIAVEKNIISTRKIIRLFKEQTRPLHKLLKLSHNPVIPGVTGSESEARKLLERLKIPLRKGTKYRLYPDLNKNEEERLATEIIELRKGESEPEDIYGYSFELSNEKKGSPLRDAREFSTMLNACGRLNKSSLGVGACLGDSASKKKALSQMGQYKYEITNALQWFGKNKETENIIHKNGFIIINAGESIPSNIIGTVASILSHSGEFDKMTYILGLAQIAELNATKVSLRVSRNHPGKHVDLHKVIREISQGLDAESGGHGIAAGAIIPTGKETEFIEKAQFILGNYMLEEKVK